MGFLSINFNGLKKNIFHAINYFFFVSWFMYFINFNVDATFIEKIIVFFLMYKCTVYLYSTYLESNVNKIYSALFESNKNVSNVKDETDKELKQNELDEVIGQESDESKEIKENKSDEIIKESKKEEIQESKKEEIQESKKEEIQESKKEIQESNKEEIQESNDK
jgi:hypothetical protein